MGRRTLLICDNCGQEKELLPRNDYDDAKYDGWLQLGLEGGDLVACSDCVPALVKAFPAVGPALEREREFFERWRKRRELRRVHHDES